MDRRLLLELLPGVAFLIAYAATDLLWAAFASASATVVAVWLRWRWDKTVPLLALATLAIVIILTCLGFIFDN